MSKKRAPTPKEEVTAAKALVMLEKVTPGDAGAAKALEDLRRFLRSEAGLDVYQQ